MMEDKDIDNLFRKKLKDQEFGFNEKSWEAAENLINKEEKTRRGPGFFLRGGLFLGVTIFGALALLLLNDSVMEQISDRSNTASTVNTSSAISEKEGQEKKNNSEQAENNKNILKKTAVSGAQNYPAPSDQEHKIDDAKIIETSSEKTRITSDISKGESAKLKDDLTAESFVQKDHMKEKKALEHSGQSSDAGIINFKKETISSEEISIERMNLIAIPFLTSETDHTLLPNTAYKEADGLNGLRRFRVDAVGGGILSRGFVNTGISRSQPGISAFGGLGISYQLNYLVSLNTKLLYSSRGALSSSVTDLSGSAENVSITSTTLQLHYFELPAYLGYRFGKHTLQAGLQYAQLLATHEELEETDANNNTKTQKTGGSTEKFSNTDLGVLLGYEYLLTEKWNLGMNVNYGLYDITDDNAFNNIRRDKNIQARVSVSYRLLGY